ncbi:hypothetical protein B8W90_14460, partial [Staphylococcus hominis]
WPDFRAAGQARHEPGAGPPGHHDRCSVPGADRHAGGAASADSAAARAGVRGDVRAPDLPDQPHRDDGGP